MWSHAFDQNIIDYVINKKFNLKPNIPYVKYRDIRTLINICSEIEPEFKKYYDIELKKRMNGQGLLHHNALADCHWQVAIVSQCFQILGIK
jgi:hypothetical protein